MAINKDENIIICIWFESHSDFFVLNRFEKALLNKTKLYSLLYSLSLSTYLLISLWEFSDLLINFVSLSDIVSIVSLAFESRLLSVG